MIATAERFAVRRLPRVRLAGVRVDVVHCLAPEDLLRPLLRQPVCQQVITANANYLRLATRDAELRSIIETAALVVPDGAPLVWAARLAGAPASRRVTGHDLTQALVRLSASEGFSLFLLGAAPGVAQRASETMRKLSPGARIAGTYSPSLSAYPFPEEENRRMVEAVNESGAAALLVALGCPKQDRWLATHRAGLRPSLAIGVGGVLDVMAGDLVRAPIWAQRAGLEWLHRALQEPRRLLPRYILDALFLSRVLLGSGTSRLIGAGR